MNHKPVQVDGMGAKWPGLDLNHADMFQPRLYARCGVVIYITKRERDHFKRKYNNQWIHRDPYWYGIEDAAGLVRQLHYHKITSTDIECIVSFFET